MITDSLGVKCRAWSGVEVVSIATSPHPAHLNACLPRMRPHPLQNNLRLSALIQVRGRKYAGTAGCARASPARMFNARSTRYLYMIFRYRKHSGCHEQIRKSGGGQTASTQPCLSTCFTQALTGNSRSRHHKSRPPVDCVDLRGEARAVPTTCGAALWSPK